MDSRSGHYRIVERSQRAIDTTAGSQATPALIRHVSTGSWALNWLQKVRQSQQLWVACLVA